MKNLFIAFLLASAVATGLYIFSDDLKSGLGMENTANEVTGLPADKPETFSAQAERNNPKAENLPEVDESALRYFASRGDKARLQAEIARLKALYPNWSPPEDPLAPLKIRDTKLDQFWKFYADGQYAELRKAIATAKIQEPDWVVPADLLASLELAEARQRLVNASDNKQYDMVVNLASQAAQLLTCNEVDVLWRLAEAFVKQDKAERARDGYLYILKNCTVPADRLVTIQKALENLPYEQARQVLEQQKTGADGKGEFASLSDDIARRFVTLAAQNPDMKIDKSYLSSLEALSQKDGSALDAETLGWYYLRRNEMPAAEKWFLTAKEKDDSVTVSQGLALILNSRGDFAQAENIMYPWRDQSPEASAVYFATTANLLTNDPPVKLPAAITQDVMTRIAAAVIAEKNVSTAEQLGWYARAIGQHPTAIQWFQTALSWDSSSEASAYGLALSLFTIGDKAGVEQVKHVWAPLSQRIADLGIKGGKSGKTALPGAIASQPAETILQVVPRQQQARSAISAQRQEQAPRVQRQPPSSANANARNCRATVEGPMPTGSNAVAHGWCLMEMNRPLEAVKSFESALATGSANDRADAAYGQALAYLRVGLVDKAAVSAIKAPMSKARQRELRVSILSGRAVAAYKSGQFRDTLFILEQRAQIAPPRKDLMALQAASYLKLRRYDDARIIYEALAASGDREGIRGVASIREIQGSN
ncbi:tetratricopeptide (TPR) repeat protein [Paenochrobactrum gallinarii]|uniref:Tetratricopeptide (TPR) repeat protein n=1 Tax=Paenochrobactrum gallinarii TaxID=643673 RepID=A0A841M3C2_9HYPH|nr:tetratricopeptide repeat protein [Paenochrobactrum gallinarii]MBB6262269.1 tetratricopeptide (TPR) repeat protein [Paenochrobactrum gallinarii]